MTVTLLCLLRDASPANLLPASAAEFPGLIPRSGSSFNPFVPAAALRGGTAERTGVPEGHTAGGWCRGGCAVTLWLCAGYRGQT